MKIQKLHKVVPYLIIAAICTTLFTKVLGSGDEFWNYNFARNVANGLAPYRDFSIIQTPLSAYIAGTFLWIFGKGILVHRILGYALAVTIFCTAYHLYKKICKMPFISFISVLFLFAIHFPCLIYNYNYLSLLMLLLIFELELSNEKGDLWKHIFVGFLAGLAVLSKQSTGALIVAANFIYCIYCLKHVKHKKKTIIARLLASGVPMLVYVSYLVFQGTFADFWEYAVEGIGTFTHRTTPLDLLKDGPGNIVFFLVIIFCYYKIIRKILKDGHDRVLVSMLIFNLAWTSVAYPLCDASHLMCVLIPLMPAALYCVKCREYKDWEKYICIAVSAMICAMVMVPFMAIGEGYIISDINNYRGVVIASEMNEGIKTITSYIQKKNEEGYHVRIAADSACAYKIPLDTYEKNWDMLLVGNIGNNDIKSLLGEDEKTIYLVYKDSTVLGKQNHFELIDYIKTNYVKIDEVMKYDVYESQN